MNDTPEYRRLRSHLAGLGGKRTAPLSPSERAWRYLSQTGRITPAQRRRFAKKANRLGSQGATSIYTAIDETTKKEI